MSRGTRDRMPPEQLYYAQFESLLCQRREHGTRKAGVRRASDAGRFIPIERVRHSGACRAPDTQVNPWAPDEGRYVTWKITGPSV